MEVPGLKLVSETWVRFIYFRELFQTDTDKTFQIEAREIFPGGRLTQFADEATDFGVSTPSRITCVSQFPSGKHRRSFVSPRRTGRRETETERPFCAFNIPASYVTSRPRASLPVSDDRSLPLVCRLMRPTARTSVQTSS